jgi:hypothetical protein
MCKQFSLELDEFGFTAEELPTCEEELPFTAEDELPATASLDAGLLLLDVGLLPLDAGLLPLEAGLLPLEAGFAFSDDAGLLPLEDGWAFPDDAGLELSELAISVAEERSSSANCSGSADEEASSQAVKPSMAPVIIARPNALEKFFLFILFLLFKTYSVLYNFLIFSSS